MTLEEFGRLTSEAKIKQLCQELEGCFLANSVVYDLNEMLAAYPKYEMFVWTAAMLLVEQKKLGLIQAQIGRQVRWLMTHPDYQRVYDNKKFICPLAKS